MAIEEYITPRFVPQGDRDTAPNERTSLGDCLGHYNLTLWDRREYRVEILKRVAEEIDKRHITRSPSLVGMNCYRR